MEPFRPHVPLVRPSHASRDARGRGLAQVVTGHPLVVTGLAQVVTGLAHVV